MAAVHLRAALALWRGPALTGAAGAYVGAAAATLHNRRLAAHEELADLELLLGRSGPALLPAGIPAFTSRAAHLSQLDALLAGESTVVIAGIAGTAGVGKPESGF